MSFGFGISDFEYVLTLGLRLRNFVRSIKDAPKDFDALRSEAECLEVCLNVLQYRECAEVISNVTSEQAKDLNTIVRSCGLNMTDLIKFIAKCQRITIDSTGGKPGRVSMTEWFKRKGKRLWSKMKFVNADKQPMRDKLAIPTQSLNIYLVSLTFASLSYNTRLSHGPTGPLPVPPAWTESWAVVGNKVAFKIANFTLRDLLKPGVEDGIIDCAKRKIDGNGDKGKGKKPGANNGGMKIPKRPRRKSSFGPRDPDGMFLVRSKNRARSRSRVNSSVEIVKADYDFGDDSGSDSVGFDGQPLSPNRGNSSPPRRGLEADERYETRSPRSESPFPPPPPPPGDQYFFDRSRSTGYSHLENDDWQNTLRQLRPRAHARAQEEIRKERKEAIEEMAEGYEEEIIASETHPRRSGSATSDDPPDIRAYMEATYGVIIDMAPPEIEAINLSHFSPLASRSRMFEKLQEFKDSRRTHYEDEGDSDIESNADSEPDVSARLSEAYRKSFSARPNRKQSEVHEPTTFKIPTNTEYVSRTETFETRHTSTDDRHREQLLRERELSLREREASLREREVLLAARERRLDRRDHSTDERARGDFEAEERARENLRFFKQREREEPPIIIQPERPENPHSRSYRNDVHLGPVDHRRPPRRSASYSGPSEEVNISKHSSEDDSMYGPQRPERRREYREQISYEPPQIIRRRSSSSSDDDKEFIVERRRK
jgi:hypothetical protein